MNGPCSHSHCSKLDLKTFVPSFEHIIYRTINGSLFRAHSVTFWSQLWRDECAWWAWMLCSWVWAGGWWQRVPGHKSHDRKGIFVWPRCSLDTLPWHPVCRLIHYAWAIYLKSWASCQKLEWVSLAKCAFCGFSGRIEAQHFEALKRHKVKAILGEATELKMIVVQIFYNRRSDKASRIFSFKHLRHRFWVAIFTFSLLPVSSILTDCCGQHSRASLLPWDVAQLLLQDYNNLCLEA